MPKTKELTIEADEVRVIPHRYNGVKVVVEDPVMDELLASIEWSDIVEFIQSETKNPDDVFDSEYLHKWAEENGYTKQ